MKYILFLVFTSISISSYSQGFISKQDSITVEEKFSRLLNISKDSITNSNLYSYLSIWLDAPYQYAGKSMNGIDCSGFTKKVYKNVFGIELPGGGSADMFPYVTAVDSGELKEGDLLFFKIYKGRISHVGVYLKNNKFIHASTYRGVVVDDLSQAYYKKHFYKAGRVPKQG